MDSPGRPDGRGQPEAQPAPPAPAGHGPTGDPGSGGFGAPGGSGGNHDRPGGRDHQPGPGLPAPAAGGTVRGTPGPPGPAPAPAGHRHGQTGGPGTQCVLGRGLHLRLSGGRQYGRASGGGRGDRGLRLFLPPGPPPHRRPGGTHRRRPGVPGGYAPAPQRGFGPPGIVPGRPGKLLHHPGAGMGALRLDQGPGHERRPQPDRGVEPGPVRHGPPLRLPQIPGFRRH